MNDFPEKFVWFELMELSEPSTNGLRVIVAESITRYDSPDFADEIVGKAYPMTVGSDSRVFEIIWDYTAAYSVTNESYGLPSNADVTRSESALREYSQSRYLEFVRANSTAEFIRGKPLRHWFIGCQNHCIDVAAWNDPQVHRLENYRMPDWISSPKQH
jgi:hypothetical protein